MQQTLPKYLFGASDYLYNFHGKEADDEIQGNGKSINYTYRMHDPRIGRWLTIDPLFHVDQSLDCKFDNNPVVLLDPLGTDSEQPDQTVVFKPMMNVVAKKSNELSERGVTIDFGHAIEAEKMENV